MIITPIIIPTNHEEPKCPNCGKNENIIQVCKHCGYEYDEENAKWWEFLLATIVIVIITVIFIFSVWTIMDWLSDFDNKHLSLFECFKNNIKWLLNKKIL